MFLRVVWASLRRQGFRLGAAVAAMVLGSSLFAALLNLSFDAGGKAGRELRAYGANVLLFPREELRGPSAGLEALGVAVEDAGIPESSLGSLDGVDGIVGFAPYLYSVVEVAGQAVVAAGIDFDRLKGVSPWWKIDGRWPEERAEGLVGVSAAQSLGLASGSHVWLRYGESTSEADVAGIVETGGPEDGQLFFPLPLIQRLTGRQGQVGLVQVSVLSRTGSLQAVAGEIARRLPGVRVRMLDQFAQADEIILGKIRLLLGLVAGLVLIVAALTVGSTMFAEVLYRKDEIGLMKALGATRKRVAAFFLVEGMSIGILGGVVGYGAGLGAAALIGQHVFGAALVPSSLGFPATAALALGVAAATSLLPVRRVLAMEPSVTLRGE